MSAFRLLCLQRPGRRHHDTARVTPTINIFSCLCAATAAQEDCLERDVGAPVVTAVEGTGNQTAPKALVGSNGEKRPSTEQGVEPGPTAARTPNPDNVKPADEDHKPRHEPPTAKSIRRLLRSTSGPNATSMQPVEHNPAASVPDLRGITDPGIAQLLAGRCTAQPTSSGQQPSHPPRHDLSHTKLLQPGARLKGSNKRELGQEPHTTTTASAPPQGSHGRGRHALVPTAPIDADKIPVMRAEWTLPHRGEDGNGLCDTDLLGVAEAEDAATRTAAWVASIGLSTASNGSGIGGCGVSSQPFNTEIAPLCDQNDDNMEPDGSAGAAVKKRSRTVNGVLTAGSGGSGRQSRSGHAGQQGFGITPRPATTSTKRPPLRRACTAILLARTATANGAHHPSGFAADMASCSTSRYMSQGLMLTAALKLSANQQAARRMRVSASAASTGAVAPPA